MNQELNPGLTMEHVGGVESQADVNAQMAGQGFMAAQKQRSALREQRVLRAGQLVRDVKNGVTDPYLLKQAFYPTNGYAIAHLNESYPGLFPKGTIGLRETMSYSDFSALTVDVLDRLLYGRYTVSPIANRPLVKEVPLRDFRVVARYTVDYATKPWSRMPEEDAATSIVPAGAGEPPTERSIQQTARQVAGSTQRVTYQPQMYQGMMSVNWRALVNDDLGIFEEDIGRLSDGGLRTIYKYITQLYLASTGVNTTLYNSTFRNLVTTTYGAASNNPALSFQGLIDAIAVLEKQLDLDGQPIDFNGQLYLWCGPSLMTTAQALVNAVQADISVGGGTTNTQGFPSQRLRVGTGYVTRNMQVIVDKYIPIVVTSGTVGATIWGLTYQPSSQARPSLELGFLRGFNTPQLYQKVPNTMRVGGGIDPMMGDFYSQNQEFKGVLVFGGTQIDGRSTVASTGQGT